MEVNACTLIIPALGSIRSEEERNSIVSCTIQLRTQSMTSHDYIQFINVLKTIPLDDRQAHVDRVLLGLQEGQQQGFINEHNIFTYTYELLRNPHYPISTNTEITGQEAIIAQGQAIKDTYRKLVTDPSTAPVIEVHLPTGGQRIW